MNPIKHLLAIHRVWGLQLNKYYDQLLSFFGSWEELWRSKKPPEELAIPAPLWDKLQEAKKSIEPDSLVAELREKGLGIIIREHQHYPRLLLQITNIPCILYYCGRLSLLKEDSLAVVGSRNATPYGLQQSRDICRELAANGLVIVSGMARGIDAAAHVGALEAKDGGTIAVLGCGVDIIYPRENTKLYHRLQEEGLLISEFPIGTAPLPYFFPIRNRIISGLSRAVFIVEAQAKSGTLITCDYALEQGKDVYALPGPVTSPNSIGTVRLIQNGAKAVIHAGDILEDLGYSFGECLFAKQKENRKAISSTEKKILNRLGWEPVHLDILLADFAETASLYQDLLTLELKGLIKQLPGKYYIRI
ncbi:MAG: DNA-processing protein DprA [Peptococcia bacterium]